MQGRKLQLCTFMNETKNIGHMPHIVFLFSDVYGFNRTPDRLACSIGSVKDKMR